MSKILLTAGLLLLAAGISCGTAQAQSAMPTPTEPAILAEPTPAQTGVFYRIDLVWNDQSNRYFSTPTYSMAQIAASGKDSHSIFCVHVKHDISGNTDEMMPWPVPELLGIPTCYALGIPGEIVVAGGKLGRITDEAYMLPPDLPAPHFQYMGSGYFQDLILPIPLSPSAVPHQPATPYRTHTLTPTRTLTIIATPTRTPTPVLDSTNTPIPIPTVTLTPTLTPSPTPSPTPTITPTYTPSPTAPR